MANLPALSIREPWCYAILCLDKTVENRTWPTQVRGRVVLHAAKTWDEEGACWLLEWGHRLPERSSFVLGALVGEVEIEDCRRLTVAEALGTGGDPWAFGPWCFVLGQRKRYAEPIPTRGYPGFFRVEIG
jgi:hypothetical protein